MSFMASVSLCAGIIPLEPLGCSSCTEPTSPAFRFGFCVLLDFLSELKFYPYLKGHDNILLLHRVYVDVEQELLFLIFPFAEYEDLFEVLKKRKQPFSESEVRWLCKQLFEAVLELHRRGIGMRGRSDFASSSFLSFLHSGCFPKQCNFWELYTQFRQNEPGAHLFVRSSVDNSVRSLFFRAPYVVRMDFKKATAHTPGTPDVEFFLAGVSTLPGSVTLSLVPRARQHVAHQQAAHGAEASPRVVMHVVFPDFGSQVLAVVNTETGARHLACTSAAGSLRRGLGFLLVRKKSHCCQGDIDECNARMFRSAFLILLDLSLENVLIFRCPKTGFIIPKLTDPGQAVVACPDAAARAQQAAVAEGVADISKKSLSRRSATIKPVYLPPDKIFGKSFRPPEVYRQCR